MYCALFAPGFFDVTCGFWTTLTCFMPGSMGTIICIKGPVQLACRRVSDIPPIMPAAPMPFRQSTVVSLERRGEQTSHPTHAISSTMAHTRHV